MIEEDENARRAGSSQDRGGRTYRFLAEQPVAILRGIKPKKGESLVEWGVLSVLDLITTYPHRYIDRTRQVPVAAAVEVSNSEGADGSKLEVVVLADVRRVALKGAPGGRRGGRGRGRVEVEVFDETGTLHVVFFNQPWRVHQLSVGTTALYSGKVTDFRGARQMVNPVVDVLMEGALSRDAESSSVSEEVGVLARRRHTLRIVPVYPQSAKSGLTSAELGGWIAEALDRAGRFADPLPERWRGQLDLVGRTEALTGIHIPSSEGEWQTGRRRLAFDELFRLQLALVLRRRRTERDARAIRHEVSVLDVTGSTARTGQVELVPPTGSHLVRDFLSALPFELTQAQRRALAAIVAELAGPLPMHRLLQGDVGSGKTVVAVATLLAAVQGGHQGALMVPTEVLSEQHWLTVRHMTRTLTVEDPSRLDGRRPIHIELLTHRTTAKERLTTLEGLRNGDVDIVVGTHALLTEDVEFRSLGAVVIDEQHRFGVEQRATLREKGRSSAGSGDPDLLVMTATPIPRTAAMVLYGDLDMVVLDELPPGRAPITTAWARSEVEREAAWERVRTEVALGNRAFVVCPLVEDSEHVEARSVVEEEATLARKELQGVSLGIMHGQMLSSEKEAVMTAFRRGEIEVLVATTVIEVGIDIPDATVMVVEDAGRFGLSQLHQLRGRVGRSTKPSWCYLLDEAASGDAARRLEALEATTDGFVLAEVDLEIRGEGTILGARQKGRSDLVLANLKEHGDLLDAARRVAEDVVTANASLGEQPHLRDEVRLFLDPEDEEFLFKS